MSLEVKVSDIWDFYNRNKSELKTKMMCVASDTFGCEIYITDNLGFLSFEVCDNDSTVCAESATNKIEAEEVYYDLISDYLIDEPLRLADDDSANSSLICLIEDLGYDSSFLDEFNLEDIRMTFDAFLQDYYDGLMEDDSLKGGE